MNSAVRCLLLLFLSGHSQVTRSQNKRLSKWISQSRHYYQKRLKGEKAGLTDDKIKLLQRFNFIFEYDDLPERHTFEEKLEWLKKYKEQHGECAVLY